MSREAVNIIIVVVGDSGGGVRGGLNEAVAVGNCGGEGCGDSRRGIPGGFGWDRLRRGGGRRRKSHGDQCCLNWWVSKRLRRLSTREYVGNLLV